MSKTSIIDTSALKDKLQEYATKVGRISARPLLLLYFIMVSKDTPKSDKLMILSTISYLIFPVDLISAKRLPIIGWIDEAFSLSVAYQKVSKNITPAENGGYPPTQNGDIRSLFWLFSLMALQN